VRNLNLFENVLVGSDLAHEVEEVERRIRIELSDRDIPQIELDNLFQVVLQDVRIELFDNRTDRLHEHVSLGGRLGLSFNVAGPQKFNVEMLPLRVEYQKIGHSYTSYK